MAPVEKPPLLWFQSGIFLGTLLVAVIGVPWYGFTVGFHWSAWLGFVLFSAATGLSITAGYHRLWSHNAYKAHPVLKVLLALFGAATLQNSILIWASGHRRHHRHVDDVDLDPYSARRGLWFSHIGWMLRAYPSGTVDFSNARDLERDPVVMWQHKNYAVLAITMNLVPPLLLGFITGDYLANLLLAGFLRLVYSHHTTFFINSLAHFWGKQPYTDTNTARDNGVLALMTYGEGYHNFHHLFQNDYRNGVRWWQFDPTKWLITASSWVGLTKDLNRVPNFRIREALVDMQFKRARQKLDAAHNADHWKELLASEYQQFAANLMEWKTLREQWYNQKRQQLATTAQEKRARFAATAQDFQRVWEQNTLRSRFKELEYALKLQQKRLKYLNVQLAATA